MLIEYPADGPSLPKPPTLHGFVETVVGQLFGTTSVVAVFVVTAFIVWSWIKWVRTTTKTTRKVAVLSRDAARITFQRLREMRSVSIAFAIAVTTAIGSLQALWLYGGYASASLADQILGQLFRGEKGPDEFVLHWNMVTGSYVLLCGLFLVISYVLVACRPNHDSTEGLLIAMFVVTASLPGLLLVAGVLLMLFGLIVITILVFLFGGKYVWQSNDFVPMLVYLALLTVQAAACPYAFFVPRLTRLVWQRQPNAAGEVSSLGRGR